FVICHLSSIAMTPQGLSCRWWHFAARIAKVVDALPDTRTGRHAKAASRTGPDEEKRQASSHDQ
ncbi:MAG: hypothetical protein ABSG04_05825, partial [Verrucomicrobiota bacterium]